MEYLDKHVETELVLVFLMQEQMEYCICLCVCVECVLVVSWDARLYC